MRKILFVILLSAIFLTACSDKQEYEHDENTLEGKVERHIKENYTDTSIKELTINDDAGKGEGKIILAHLSFDVKNKAKTAQGMIDMYSEDLGATFAKEAEVNEVTVFWEVPYLLEGKNIAKMNMQRSGDGMAIEEDWHDPNIFKE